MKKECWSCGTPIFMKDAADIRTVYPGQRTEYLCKSCKQKQVDALIEKTRKGLGLPPLKNP